MNGLEPYYYLRYVSTTLSTTTEAKLFGHLPWNLDAKSLDRLTVEDAQQLLDSIAVE